MLKPAGVVISLLLLVSPAVYSQEFLYSQNQLGINAGLSLGIGTHVNRIGFYFGGYAFESHFQFNAIARISYNYKHLGPPGRGWEKQIGLGAVYGFYYRDNYNPFHQLVSNQMNWLHSFGLGYYYYRDSWETSQFTGTVGYQGGDFEVIHENDAFGKSSDRYRTAALLVGYRMGNSRVVVNTTLWTGNANDNNVRKVRESDFSRFGYKDLSNAKHGKFSHGLLSLQWDQAFSYGQVSTLNCGIDSERVRNFLQNKVMHDMYMWPEKWNTAKNPHIPMLDRDGNPFLYVDGQSVRKNTLYFGIRLNDIGFY